MESLITQTSDSLQDNSGVNNIEYFDNPIPLTHYNPIEDSTTIILDTPMTPHEGTRLAVVEHIYQSQDNNISVESTDSMWIQRIGRIDFLLIYHAIVVVSMLFLTVSIVGSTTTWYRELNKGPIDPWLIRFGWIIATLLSYVGLFLLWENVRPNEVSLDLAITVLFLISTFLSLGWASIFYYSKNIGLSLWLVGILFVYKFWLFIYIWYIKPLAAVFLIPILLMYIYLMYSVAHLAYLNNVKL